MGLATDFALQPLRDEGAPPSTDATVGLSPLDGLAGNWTGQGFNAIWYPHSGASDHFLELNVTNDRIDLEVLKRLIPNRGFVYHTGHADQALDQTAVPQVGYATRHLLRRSGTGLLRWRAD
jgi:hypothetical protein